MENSAAMKLNGLDTEADRTPKSTNAKSLAIMVAGPVLIGAWSATCFVGLILSYGGQNVWSLIS